MPKSVTKLLVVLADTKLD